MKDSKQIVKGINERDLKYSNFCFHLLAHGKYVGWRTIQIYTV